MNTFALFRKVSCSGRHTLRVTGVSNLDFRAGFSSVPVSEFNHTRERPVKGAWHIYFSFLKLISLGILTADDLMVISLHLPQDFQPTFYWNVVAWSLQVSWATWSWCPAQDARCAQSPSRCPLTLADKDCGVSRSSALPPRASSSRWQAKTRRATASRGCLVSLTPTSFQARHPPPHHHHHLPADTSYQSHSTVSLTPHQSLRWPLTFPSSPVDPPAVRMPDVVKGFYMQPTVIACSVESDVPYRLRFSRSGITLGEEKFFQWVFRSSSDSPQMLQLHEPITCSKNTN